MIVQRASYELLAVGCETHSYEAAFCLEACTIELYQYKSAPITIGATKAL